MQKLYCDWTEGMQYFLDFMVHPIFVENGVVWVGWTGVIVVDACDDSFVVAAHIHSWFGLICCWTLSKIIL